MCCQLFTSFKKWLNHCYLHRTFFSGILNVTHLFPRFKSSDEKSVNVYGVYNIVNVSLDWYWYEVKAQMYQMRDKYVQLLNRCKATNVVTTTKLSNVLCSVVLLYCERCTLHVMICFTVYSESNLGRRSCIAAGKAEPSYLVFMAQHADLMLLSQLICYWNLQFEHL